VKIIFPSTKHCLNHSNSGNYSPLVPMQEQVYWLYNCSYDYLKSSYVKKIECLSGSNYDVIAATFEVMCNDSKALNCEKLGSIRVPGESGPEMMDYYSDLSSVLQTKQKNSSQKTSLLGEIAHLIYKPLISCPYNRYRTSLIPCNWSNP